MIKSNVDTARLQYIINLREIFPVDIDLDNTVNQINVRLRPEFVHDISK